MVYAAPHLRLVLSGTLYDVEGFSFGLNLIGGGSAPSEVPQAVIDACTAYFTAVNIDNSAVLRTIKLNLIGTDGRYASDSDTVVHDYPLPGIAGIGTQNPPPQIALAVSLMTNKQRGRASKGRFYLPLPTLPVGSDGMLTSANALSYAEPTAVFINDLNEALPEFTVGVVSDIGTGAQSAVTGVRVGRVYDTIRSRRRSLPEAHVESTTAVVPNFSGGAGGF